VASPNQDRGPRSKDARVERFKARTRSWACSLASVLGLALLASALQGCSGVNYGLTKQDPEFVVTDLEQVFDRVEQDNQTALDELDDSFRWQLREVCTDAARRRIHEQWDRVRFARLQTLVLQRIDEVERVMGWGATASSASQLEAVPPIEALPDGDLPPIDPGPDDDLPPIDPDADPDLPPIDPDAGGGPAPSRPTPTVVLKTKRRLSPIERLQREMWPVWPDNPRDLAQLRQAVLDYKCIRRENRNIELRNDAQDRRLTGLRFYQPSPYLLVYSDGKGGINWEIHHLPDPTKKMSAKPYNFLSSLKFTLTIDESSQVMTKATEIGDSTAAPKAVLKAIKELVPAIKGALLNAIGESKRLGLIPTPHLYKIVTDKKGTRLIGGQGDVSAIRYVKLDAKTKTGGNVNASSKPAPGSGQGD